MSKTLILSILIGIACLTQVLPAQQAAFQVVVHADNPSDSLPASRVAKLFLKQVTRWGHSLKVAPVEQVGSPEVRVRFSDQILNLPVTAVESYWQRMIYSGRGVPPIRLASDTEVVAYVKAHPSAIGYVSKGANTTGVKVVSISD